MSGHGGGHESGGGSGADLINTPDSNPGWGLLYILFMVFVAAGPEFFNQVVARTL
jgi:hypothetical protein